MKIISIIILFVIFAALTNLSENISELVTDTTTTTEQTSFIQKSIEAEVNSFYDISVEFIESEGAFIFSGAISWINSSPSSLDTIYINLPVSRDKKVKYIIDYENIFNSNQIEFVENKNEFFIDSTLIKLALHTPLKQGDTLKLEFAYKAELASKDEFKDNLFLFFKDWHPKVAVYSDSGFIAYPHHDYIKSYSDFSNYKIKLKIPSYFQIAAANKSKIDDSGSDIYNCSLQNSPSFNWFFFTGLIESSVEIDIVGSRTNLEIYSQKGNDNYIERYADAVSNYLTSMNHFMDKLPYNLTVVELPQNSEYLSSSYPGIIATEFEIISPLNSQKLEYRIGSLVAEQYFGNIIVPNEFESSWLSKGLSAYVAEKMVRKFYGDLYSYFNFSTYYPIRGLHFLSYSDIPLIYTIGNNKIPEGGRFIEKYYQYFNYSDMSVESAEYPGYEEYEVSSIIKPQLALLTLEKFLGQESITQNLENYFRNFRYSHPNANNFLNEIKNGCDEESLVMLNDLFHSGKRFDYAVQEIKKLSEQEYEVLIVRNEDGISPVRISINTELDTLDYFWNGEERFKKIRFNSRNEVLSVEIDPEQQNLLDLNFSNNSYVMENQYWGSLSFATRVFFWFQNAFLIFGGIG